MITLGREFCNAHRSLFSFFSILDQEEAKKFLLGKPGDKYNFFMKATELERIDKKYAETSDKAEDLKAKHSSVVSQLEEKHAIAEELKKKYEMHTSVQKLEKKLLEYQIQYCWAFYAERNEEYQDILKVSFIVFHQCFSLTLFVLFQTDACFFNDIEKRRVCAETSG